jgi:uncharacterized repeat protein (TIGR03806 family)
MMLMLACAGCGPARQVPTPAPAEEIGQSAAGPPERLSAYGLFVGDLASQEPDAGVIPYDLNSALFSDYAIKYRFVKLPPGGTAVYSRDDVFDFPVGTVIAKTFAYPRDARDPSLGRRLIETRILKREPDGWVGLPYIWNREQTDATLELAGDTIDVEWIHTDGRARANNYIVPNANQCKGCHLAGDAVVPIGPKARHLNRSFTYTTGTENQLVHWMNASALTRAPAPAEAPRLAAWDDPNSGSLDARARAWLEINCAHCHNPRGPARNSGLDLLFSQRNPTSYGIYKAPVAAGRGSGGREFDIVPGQPDQSIFTYRIASTDAGIMMPELGKRLVHQEGLALIREWIASLADPKKSGSAPVTLGPKNARPRSSASSTAPGSCPEGALDGNRFSLEPGSLWKGSAGEPAWSYTIEFPEPREVGAILQIHGDHEYVLRNTPKTYVWQTTTDGTHWEDLKETAVADERRLFRVHRLNGKRRVRTLRLAISAAEGELPAVRELEFFPEQDAKISFPVWAVIVSTTGQTQVPGAGAEAFRRLARSCDGWEQMQFQNVWLGDFQQDFVANEPRPLAAFLSGNFIDWCQQNRDHWRGTADVLRHASLPVWASCGGAQGLAILAENGVDQPWDCPQCRDPAHPRLPIYTHIAGSAKRACGDYTGCVFERGAFTIRQLTADPVLQGLPSEFRAMESHCGQIGWAPKGWELIATCGAGGKTKTQCLRLKYQLIYAAQFHIEMDGTPESSRRIMANFLNLCNQANGEHRGSEPNTNSELVR